jgi:hypothetical protein
MFSFLPDQDLYQFWIPWRIQIGVLGAKPLNAALSQGAYFTKSVTSKICERKCVYIRFAEHCFIFQAILHYNNYSQSPFKSVAKFKLESPSKRSETPMFSWTKNEHHTKKWQKPYQKRNESEIFSHMQTGGRVPSTYLAWYQYKRFLNYLKLEKIFPSK